MKRLRYLFVVAVIALPLLVLVSPASAVTNCTAKATLPNTGVSMHGHGVITCSDASGLVRMPRITMFVHVYNYDSGADRADGSRECTDAQTCASSTDQFNCTQGNNMYAVVTFNAERPNGVIITGGDESPVEVCSS